MTIFREKSSVSTSRQVHGHLGFAKLIYWLGVPLSLGIILGWYSVGRVDLETKSLLVGFWTTFICVSWWLNICGTWGAYLLLKPWRPPSWALWLIGPLGFGLISLFPLNFLLQWGATVLPEGLQTIRPVRSFDADGFLGAYFSAALPGTALFFVINLFYEQILGIPRFRYSDRPTAEESLRDSRFDQQSPLPEPAFLQLTSSKLREGSLIAVTAQEHYISVNTTTGTELIRYSFSDAIQDLELEKGLRTHRSHWVACRAIRELVRKGSSYYLILESGSQIPVSRTYLVNVRHALDG